MVSKRFEFVEDEILIQNLAIYAQYLQFLYSISQEYSIPSSILYSTYKNIIIYGAQIIEAVCLYTIKQVFEKENNKVFGKEWKSTGKYHSELKNGSKLRLKILEEESIQKEYSSFTPFKDIINACRRSKLFDERVIKLIEKAQKSRNKIHLGALTEVDKAYTKDDINLFFSEMTTIINTCERIVVSLRS